MRFRRRWTAATDPIRHLLNLLFEHLSGVMDAMTGHSWQSQLGVKSRLIYYLRSDDSGCPGATLVKHKSQRSSRSGVQPLCYLAKYNTSGLLGLAPFMSPCPTSAH